MSPRKRKSEAVRVRKARSEADFEQIRRLDRACFPQDERLAVPGDSLWWVADAGKGRVVGYAALRVCQNPENKGLGFLNRVGVDQGFRGQGLQKRFIKARVAEAKRLGLRQLVTYVVPWNPASANSLLSCKFRMYRQHNRWGGAYSVYFSRVLA